MNKIKQVSKEIFEIIQAIDDNESDAMIYDSYEEYNKSMLDFIKSHNKQWFVKFFDMIVKNIKNEMNENSLKSELLNIPKINKHIINHVIDSIYSQDNILKDEEEDNVDFVDEQNYDVEDNAELDDINLEGVINNFKWRDNQLIAINNTIEQDFKSGIHNQVVGAGKSYIILKTIDEHLKAHNNVGIYIITCFRQEILKDLFFDSEGKLDEKRKNTLKMNEIINLDNFNIINRVHNKKKILKFNEDKATILIINTDFLKAIDKDNIIDYNKVNLIILDECHCVSADKFYTLLMKIKYDKKIHIIGFSATPLRQHAEKKLVDVFSLTMKKNTKNKKLNIISNYDFITAIKMMLFYHHITYYVKLTKL